MLFIEKKEKVALPKKYHRTNNHSALVYDHLTSLFKRPFDIFRKTSLTFAEDYGPALQALQTKQTHVLDWVKENQQHTTLTDILTKQITLGIASDMANFLYEAFSCARKDDRCLYPA